ncbi:universal stress protein [Kitasatospora sp. A2-31]|uniref:universal stress protein n=1 Tax=Kitasatospora sp. A2-31 TaxID=2916414 RepID=UPI001EEAC599|nr:universal stress protein [Kitasatospora sp. A2-31]MCG6498430.1 universal stress protein [Kitasatospora sp. A2-31]
MTTRQVLVGLDGSPQSEAAAVWAAQEAQRLGSALCLLHVWPWLSGENVDRSNSGDLRPAALDALARVADRIRVAHPGLAVEVAVRPDDPVDGLIAEAAGQEMLVLGTRGLGGFAGLLVGSVSLAVAARATVPTVLVSGRSPDHDVARATGDIVVGIDSRQPGEAVLDFAFTEAERRGATLRAVHGWEPVPAWAFGGVVPPPVDLPAQKRTESAVLSGHLAGQRASHPGVNVVEDIRLGSAARAVLDAAAGAELVVIGRRERRHHVGALLGPVAHAVLHHSTVPVAVIPHS